MKKICIKKLNVPSKGIWFHIIGISCLIWFLVRSLPAPHRSQYPCQQISRAVALTYIAYWSALFAVMAVWLRQIKLKTASIVPSVLIIFTVGGMIFAGNFFVNDKTVEWNPIVKDPIGNPVGINPGRVVWVWNPDATASDLKGYWWEPQNNNQEVIDQMFSSGLKALTGEEDDSMAWDSLFKYFNNLHGKGEVGYQHGEKIAIKVNMNNCWALQKSLYT